MSPGSLSTSTVPHVRHARADIPRLQRLLPAHSTQTAREFAALDRSTTAVAVGHGRTLFHEGDPARYFFRIVSGAVRSCRLLPDGRRQIGDFFLPDDFFGFGAADVYLHSAEAIVDTSLIAYPRKLLDGTLPGPARFARALLTIMSRRLADAQQQMVLLGRKTAEERVATFLLGMSERCGDCNHIQLLMTREDIADHLGLTTETVSRTLTKLRADGFISFRAPSDIHFIDRDALMELAEGS